MLTDISVMGAIRSLRPVSQALLHSGCIYTKKKYRLEIAIIGVSEVIVMK